MDNPASAAAAGVGSQMGPASAPDLPSLSARVLTAGHCPPLVLSSVYNDSLLLKDSIRDQCLLAGRSRAACGQLGRIDLSTTRTRPPHASKESFPSLPAPCGSSASGGGRDLESAVRKYEGVLKAQVHGGLFDRDRSKQEPGPRGPQTTGDQPCRLSGLQGDYSVDVDRHTSSQEVYSGLSSYLTAASLRHSLQLTNALEIDRDAYRWRKEKENLLSALRDAPVFTMSGDIAGLACDQPISTALLHQYKSFAGPLAAGTQPTGLRQSPSLTRSEYQLIQFLLRHSRGARSVAHRTTVERLPLHLLLQLSRVAPPSTSLASFREGLDGTGVPLDLEDQQILQHLTASHTDPMRGGSDPVGESWDLVYTPQQQHQFVSLARLLVGGCRLLLLAEEKNQDSVRGADLLYHGAADEPLSRHKGRKGEPPSLNAFVLCGIVGNSIAALELDKREQLQSLAEQTGAGTSWWRGQHWATSDRVTCGQQASEPWLRLAANEVQVERSEVGSGLANADLGTDTSQAPGDARGGTSLWWRAVYYAFRTGDLKCLLTLGAGKFVQQTGLGGVCTMLEASAAITAAANAAPGADDVGERPSDVDEDLLATTEEKTSPFPPSQPPLLPFICRQLLVMLLQTSVAANQRNARDLITNDEQEKNLSDFFSSLPSVAALQPRSMQTAMAQLLLLYPPPPSGVTGGEGTQGKNASSVLDPHLLLLLSLINPTVWLPISIAQTLPNATQEDFLHYKLHLAHATSAISLEPDKDLCLSLKELAVKLRQQGPSYFDSEDPSSLSSLVPNDYFNPSSLMHINFGYPRVLALCGCFVEATIWLLDAFPLFRRPGLLLFLLLRSCGALHNHQLNQLDSTSYSFRRETGKDFDGGDGDREEVPTDDEEGDQEDDTRTASYMLLRVIRRGLTGSSALTQIVLLTILPSSLWSAIISRLVSGQFSLLSSSTILGDMTSNGDDIAPGLLARVLSHQQQQLIAGEEEQDMRINTSPWLLKGHLHQLLSCLYAALRDEGRRRGAIKEAFIAAWLLKDFRSCAEIFTDALNESAFSVYDVPPEDESEIQIASFFLSAYSLLERRLRSEDMIQALRGPWQQAKIVWATRQGNYRGALQLFHQIQQSSHPLLWAPALPPMAPGEQDLLLRTLPPGAACLVDCITFLLLKLLEQNNQLDSLISYDQLAMLQQVATSLPVSSSPRIKETRAMLGEFLRQYRDHAAYSRSVF